MKIQELRASGKPRNIPPIEVSTEFWEKLKKSKVGAKRYKEVHEPKEVKQKKEVNKLENDFN